jgi:hypothetical protein
LKLDPTAAAGLIVRGADAGGQAAAAGAMAGAAVGGGVSPIDAGVATLRAEGFAYKTGWIAAETAGSAQQQVGESGGVAALSQQESENAARLGEVGPQGAAATTATTTI